MKYERGRPVIRDRIFIFLFSYQIMQISVFLEYSEEIMKCFGATDQNTWCQFWLSWASVFLFPYKKMWCAIHIGAEDQI